MSGHDSLHAFFDGELADAEAQAFRAHLGGCDRCQAELHSLMQLSALAEPEAPVRLSTRRRPTPVPQSVRSNVIPFRQRTISVVAAGAALAALIVWGIVNVSRPAPATAGPLFALADTRRFEPRLAYAGARAYRPYSVQRSGSPSSPADFERVPLSTLERLESAGDKHGAAAGYLLRGDWKEAAALLAAVPETPDVLNDRAALALAQERPDEALRLLEDVLERAPLHGPALFNRALALQRMGLPFAAAEAFEAAARAGELGWGNEAAQRAAAVRRAEEARRKAWGDTWREGEAMVQGGPVLSAAAARAFPGMTRLLFLDAVRTGETAERVEALRPLAAALDAGTGGNALAAFLDRIGKEDFKRRGPLAHRYAALTRRALSEPETATLLRELRKARQADILLGALWYAGQIAAQVAEYRGLARDGGDPVWFEQNADLEESRAELARGDYSRAERRLAVALERCPRVEPPYRCAQLTEALTSLLVKQHRLPEAAERARAGLTLARRGQEWAQETQFLQWLGEVARFRGELAHTRAFLTEATLRHPDHCPAQVFLAVTLASLQTIALHPDAARAELAKAPERCGPYSPVGAMTLLALARMQPQPGDGAHLTAAIASMRSEQAPAGTRALGEMIAGAFLTQSDTAAGEKAVREALAQVDRLGTTDAEAVRARALAHNTLILSAGKAQRFPDVLRRLADASGVPAPERCVVGAALDDERLVLVAAGPDGAVQGLYDGRRRAPLTDVRGLVPAALLGALKGCDTVGVLARPPLHGRAELLPPELAWSYLGGGAGGNGAESAPREGSAVVVTGVEAPPALGLPRLGGFEADSAAGMTVVQGAAATPDRVLRELEQASYAELHAHGLVNAAISDASLLVLSPEADGRYALSAGDVRRARLHHHPVVLLGACRAGQTAFHFYEPWSLPVAFLQAGARAVIASPDDIPDAEAAKFLKDVRTRVLAGAAAEIAVRDARQDVLSASPTNWVRRVLVFR